MPCEDSICREHLSQRDVIKQNKIKCKKCNEEFQIKNNDFKSNNQFNKLLENQSYLSGEEISLKQALEESLRKFFQFCDEFSQNKSQLESDVFDNFQEMRFQVDEHRERLKERIDKDREELKSKIDQIALEMIDEMKKYEETFSKSLKETFDDSQKELNQLEELFRNPNLVIKSFTETRRVFKGHSIEIK